MGGKLLSLWHWGPSLTCLPQQGSPGPSKAPPSREFTVCQNKEAFDLFITKTVVT